MIKIKDKAKCTGCTACKAICPASCIEMKADKDLFLYPFVNETKCINCKLCIEVCPVLSPTESEKCEEVVSSYAVYSKDDELRKKSSSGGVFSLLANLVLNEGGVVFGAAFDKDLKVRHTYVESINELYKLRGAKYVQSEVGDCYQKAEKFLKNGRKVLFSGAPCQTEGLISYLKKDYENLYTVDFICHGVPSPMAWEKYKEYINSQNTSSLKNVYFRDKKEGWHKYSVSFEFDNQSTASHLSRNDWYMNAFLRDLCLRPSCYECAFKKPLRETDITLADFWGIDKLLPSMDDNKGTSLVFVNSEKGNHLFNHIKENVIFEETDKFDSVKHNPSMLKSVKKPSIRDKFMDDLQENGFEFVLKKYLKTGFFGKANRVIKKKLKRLFKDKA